MKTFKKINKLNSLGINIYNFLLKDYQDNPDLLLTFKNNILNIVRTNQLQISEKQHIYSVLSETNKLDFLYNEPSILDKSLANFLIEKGDYVYPNYNSIHNVPISETYLNTAIILKNINFVNKLKDVIISLEEPILIAASKLAINMSFIEFIEILPSNILEKLKNYKNNIGQNLCYLAHNVSTLEYIKQKFNLEPKSLEEWFSKYTYKKLKSFAIPSLQSEFRSILDLDNDYLNTVKYFKENNLDIEWYETNKYYKIRCPAIWNLIYQKPQYMPILEPYLSSNKLDTEKNNFPLFLMHSMKKNISVSIEDNLTEYLSFLYQKKYDLSHKNNKNKSMFDMLQLIIAKEPSSYSKKLTTFKPVFSKLFVELQIDNNIKKTNIVKTKI